MEMNQCTMLQGSTITHIYTLVQEDDTEKTIQSWSLLQYLENRYLNGYDKFSKKDLVKILSIMLSVVQSIIGIKY